MPSMRSVLLVTACSVGTLLVPSVAHATPQTGSVQLPGDAVRTIYGGDVGQNLGGVLVGPGDVNGDGVADLAAGSSRRANGAAYAIYGGANGSPLVAGAASLPKGSGFGITSLVSTATSALVGGGDVDGDKKADIGFEARVSSTVFTFAAYGDPDLGSTLKLSVNEQGPRRLYTDGSSNPGTNTGIGDVNGDGLGDVAVRTDAGYGVVYGSPGRGVALSASTPDAGTGFVLRLPGQQTGGTGRIAPAGDVNGDQLGDLLVTFPNLRRVWVVYGSTVSPGVVELAPELPVGRGFALQMPPDTTTPDTQISSLGDLNGDGYAEVAVSSPTYVGGRGKTWIVPGGPTGKGTVSLGVTGVPDGMTITGAPGTKQLAGASLTGVGDIDGDKLPEIAIGAPGADPAASGTVHVIRGLTFSPGRELELSADPTPTPDRIVIRGDASTGGLGTSIASVGGGLVALGAPSGGGAQAGLVHLVDLVGAKKPAPAPVKVDAALSERAFRPRASGGTGGTTLKLKSSTPDASVSGEIMLVKDTKTCAPSVLAPFVKGVCNPTVRRVGKLPSQKTGTTTRRIAFAGRAAGKPLASGKYLLLLRPAAGARRGPLRVVSFEIK